MVLYLELEGNAYERGFQQGLKLREKIDEALDFVFHSKMFTDLMPKYLPIKTILFGLGMYARKNIRKPIRKNFPHHFTKMMAVAEAAKIPKYMSYMCHFVEIINMMPGIIYSPDPNKNLKFGCSQLFALNKATQDQYDYFARNYDFPTILQAFQMVRKEIPVNGYININMSQFPWAPSHTGLNEMGLAVGFNNGRAWRKDNGDFTTKGVPSTFLIQEVLEKAADIEEATEIITNFSERTIGGHFGMLDAEGNARLIETTSSRFAIRDPEDGLLAHTNHYIEMKDANLPKETRFKVEGLEVHPQASPIERLRRIMELLKQNMGKLNREIIYQIMSDHNNQEPDDFTVCTHGEASTLASTIIIPKKREFWTTDNLPCQSNPELFKL